MILYALAFLIGIIAGLRAMTAPAVTSWGSWLGLVPLAGTGLGFMGSVISAVILTVLAAGELISDQLPKTPSRKSPPQFIGRLVTGGLSGATLAIGGGSMIGGFIAGILGAIVGTIGGAESRRVMGRMFGRDMPAALIEDAVAIGGAIAIVAMMP